MITSSGSPSLDLVIDQKERDDKDYEPPGWAKRHGHPDVIDRSGNPDQTEIMIDIKTGKIRSAPVITLRVDGQVIAMLRCLEVNGLNAHLEVYICPHTEDKILDALYYLSQAGIGVKVVCPGSLPNR